MGKRHEQTLFKRRHPDGRQTYEKMLNISHHRGNANQNHNGIPPPTCHNVKMNNSGNNRCLWGCRQRGTHLQCWWECKLARSLWKTVWKFLKKLKIVLPYDPAIALLGIYPIDTKILIQRGTCTPMFIAALSTIAKVWKELKCPWMNEWMNG